MLDTQTTLTGLENAAEFIARHVGPSADDQQKMLEIVGCETLQDLTRQVVPKAIAMTEALDIVDGCSEAQAIAELRVMAKQNKVLRSFIGQGYYNTFTPNVVQRNILENPRMVHRLYALSARDFAGPLGSVDQLPNLGDRPYWHGDGQRVDAG